MARRTEQRRAATWTLYQGDLLGRSPEQTLSGDAHRFTRVLADQVYRHQRELDAIISRHASGWTLGRIAPLERSILRVALLEMTRPELLPGERQIAPEEAIDEAVETAKEFCGADAPGFVNGVLGAALRELQAGATGDPAAPEPAAPAASEPAAPAASEPGAPAASEPGAPAAPESAAPGASEPGAPAAAEPVDQGASQVAGVHRLSAQESGR